jgi:hypothetical protein
MQIELTFLKVSIKKIKENLIIKYFFSFKALLNN